MAILLASANPSSAELLQNMLSRWGHEVVAVQQASAALWEMTRPDGVRLALVDSALPPHSGLDLCARIRQREDEDRPYLILISLSRFDPGVSDALASGADDYVGYPCSADELAARIGAGQRALEWQQGLLRRHQENRPPMLPICAECKSVRVSGQTWQPIETYLYQQGHPCTHGLCPWCYDLQKEMLRQEEMLLARGSDEAEGLCTSAVRSGK